MRKLSCFFLLAVLFPACQRPLLDTIPYSSRPEHRQGGRGSAEAADSAQAPPGKPDVYATALCFSADSVAGLLLFKNGKQVLSVPSGVQGDPQRHRFRDGHLWHDTTDGESTTLYCDGEPRFSFEGNELLVGFTIRDGQVHTLGQRQGRGGFSYRINGEEAFGAPGGTLLGGPYDREWEGGAFSEELYYSYGIPVWKGNQLEWEYRIMQGDRLVKTLPAGSSEAVYDIRYWGGALYRSERRVGGALCLVQDETYQTLELEDEGTPHLCKLAPFGSKMILKGYSMSGGQYRFWLRDASGALYSALSPTPFYDYYAGEEEDAFAYVILDSGGRVAKMIRKGIQVPLETGQYRLSTPLCCHFQNGIFAAALTREGTDEHLLVTDREQVSVSFSGYFTSIQIQ